MITHFAIAAYYDHTSKTIDVITHFQIIEYGHTFDQIDLITHFTISECNITFENTRKD